MWFLYLFKRIKIPLRNQWICHLICNILLKSCLLYRNHKKLIICNFFAKLKCMADCIVDTKIEIKQEYTFEKCNKPLQYNTTTKESISQAKDKFDSFINTDLNNPHKEGKYKTSLYSFSDYLAFLK